jgi:hypothetical protein
LIIQAEGVNFQAIWQYGHLIDLNEIMTNDIGAVLHTYGVEAARAAIQQQITAVFNVYGIKVNPRHLSVASHCLWSFVTSIVRFSGIKVNRDSHYQFTSTL